MLCADRPGIYEPVGQGDLTPSIVRIAAVLNPEDPTDSPAFRILPTAAPALGLDVRILEVHEASELDAAFVRAARDGAQALFVGQSPLFTSHRSDIASIKLPTMLGWREFVEAGGLMSYGPNLPEVYRHSATLVDKILKGVSPADLPVETPTDFELVVNLKTAKAIGLTISRPFLLLADQVIE